MQTKQNLDRHRDHSKQDALPASIAVHGGEVKVANATIHQEPPQAVTEKTAVERG